MEQTKTANSTAKPSRVTNRNARGYVRQRKAFNGSNTYARLTRAAASTIYTVYSYGEHFPIYVAETPDGTPHLTYWYRNTDKYSASTSKHQSQLDPQMFDMVPLSTPHMVSVSCGGLIHMMTTSYTTV